MPKKKIVFVSIKGELFPTEFDKKGRQYFVGNSCVIHLFESNKIDISLNDLYEDYLAGKFTFDDYWKFYIAKGYSVCGLEEVFGTFSLSIPKKQQIRIINPVTDNKKKKDITTKKVKTLLTLCRKNKVRASSVIYQDGLYEGCGAGWWVETKDGDGYLGRNFTKAKENIAANKIKWDND